MNTRVWLGMLVIYIVWGSTYLAIRFAVFTIPPFFMAGMRFLVAGIILYTWRRVAGDPAPNRIQWKAAGIVGLFLLLGGNGGVTWAEQMVPSGIAALLIGSEPFWVILIDALRPSGLRPNNRIVVGLGFGFMGIFLLLSASQNSSFEERLNLFAAFVILLAALSWAIGSVYVQRAQLHPSPFMASGSQMLMGGASLLLVSLITGEWNRLDVQSITSSSFLGWAYLVVFGSLLALTTYTWLLKNAPLALVSTYAYVNPLVAIILGYFLASEAVTWQIILAGGIIIASVALINSGRRFPMTPRPAPLPISVTGKE